MSLQIVQVQSSLLPVGAATEATLTSILAKLNASVAVTGPLTDTQLRSSPVPVSGPLTDSQLRAVPVSVSLASQPLPTGAATEATLVAQSSILLNDATFTSRIPTPGQKGMAASVPVVVASDQSPINVEMRSSTLRVTATGAVNNAVTATLPAAGAGLFHYITRIELVKLYATAGTASGAGVIVTSTNLPGNPAWTTEQLASPAGTVAKVILEESQAPLRSSAANVATTFVAPAQAQTIWRWNISYYTDT